MKKVADWLAAYSLSPNCDKSKFMLFYKPPRKIHIPNIKLNNNDIDHVNEFNFLGLLKTIISLGKHMLIKYATKCPSRGNNKLFKDYVTR